MIRFENNNILGPVAYIECLCSSSDHLTRLHYNAEDKEYYIEFKLLPWPSKMYGTRLWNKIKFYFSNLLYAIKGIPNTYCVEAIWNEVQAQEVKDFIEFCNKQYNPDKKEMEKHTPFKSSW